MRELAPTTAWGLPTRRALPLALLALVLGTVGPVSGAPGPVVPRALPLVNTWTKTSIDAAEHIAPAATLDYVFVALAAGTIEAHHMDGTGEVAWTKPLAAVMNLTAGDGLVYVCTADGVTALAEATGDTRWHADVKPTGANPVWRAGWLFVSTPNGTIVAYHTADGSPAWQQALGAPLASPPVPSATLLMAALSDRRVVALRLADGHELWHRTLDQTATALSWPVLSAHLSPGLETGALISVTTTAPPMPGPPLAANGLVYVSADDGCLYLLPADTGSGGQRTCVVGGRAVGGPAANASYVFAATVDGTLAAFGHHSGNLEWRRDLKARIAATPSLDGDLLLVPLATGEVVVFLTTAINKATIAMTATDPFAAQLAAPAPEGASTTQMFGPAVFAGTGDSLHIVTLTNTGQTWALSVYAKARLTIAPFSTVPGRPLPRAGSAGGRPAPR